MVTAKLFYNIKNKNISIEFECSNYSTKTTLRNICYDIKKYENDIYKSGLSIYMSWERDNIEEQDNIRHEIKWLEQDIYNYKKYNKIQIIFNKDASNQLNEKYNQLRQKNEQLKELINKKNIIELKRKELEITEDSCYSATQYQFKIDMEKFLNDLEFNYVNSFSTERNKIFTYEFYGDEKELINKAEDPYREIIIELCKKADLYIMQAAKDCDMVDKKKSQTDNNPSEEESALLHKAF